MGVEMDALLPPPFYTAEEAEAVYRQGLEDGAQNEQERIVRCLQAIAGQDREMWRRVGQVIEQVRTAQPCVPADSPGSDGLAV